MKRALFVAAAVLAMGGSAFAGDEASEIYKILAGEGFWGAIVIGVAGFLYKLCRPYVATWCEERKLMRLFLAVESCAAQTNAAFVEPIKRDSADGKLTKGEAAEAKELTRRAVVNWFISEGVDIMNEYGNVAVDAIIELIVSRMNGKVAKAVARPLSDSAQPPLPDLAQAN